MTWPVSGVTGATLRRFVVLLAGCLLIAACGSATREALSATSTPAAPLIGGTASEAPSAPGGSTQSNAPSAVPSSGAETSVPATTSAPQPTASPNETIAPATTGTPAPSAAVPTAKLTPAISPSPSDEPSASPNSSPGAAAECSGSAENRDFYAAAAQAVTWPVYCAVLPTGWFLESGSYRLGNGGHLQVSYKGPSGAWLTLQEGVYCTSGASACSPRDHELGPWVFGDLPGTLWTLGPNEPGDGYAVYVAPGQAPSWTITGTNIDQATFQALSAALVVVAP